MLCVGCEVFVHELTIDLPVATHFPYLRGQVHCLFTGFLMVTHETPSQLPTPQVVERDQLSGRIQ